ncbi:unnamed protein product [Rotaria socialis]|uniref:Voltage-dependent T-type calcium channel subunit alpha n=2 Tax=Rotaria socialis TaxID=392032 RepID=A0A818BI53_9BILA|nr:unnamed protein product [Rotaria socialis]
MDKNHLKIEINNIHHNKRRLSSISFDIPSSTYLYERDRVSQKNSSINIQSHLSPSINLEENNETQSPYPGLSEKVFYCLKQTTSPRYQCLQLIASPWFERISMLVILLNCITLGMYQPCEHHSDAQDSKKCDTARCLWLRAADYFIFAYFTIEMCIKMTAMGIFGKGAYLADTWNRLDCFIVVSGLLESVIPGDNLNLSAIRTIRVLRPLRAINRVPSMRILVMLLLDTFPMLGNVLLLCFFVFFIFGIIGVQLWKGLLRHRCFLQFNTTNILDQALFESFQLPVYYIPRDQDSFVCSFPQSNGMTKCSDVPKLRKGNMTCELDLHMYNEQLSNNPHKPINGCINWNQYYTFCNVSDHNPYSGSISFDHIGLAWIAIFQIISQESWVNIMYYIQDVHSFWDWIYFVFLIIIGSFFLINLCLVVIATQFSETKKRETERMLNERRRYSRSSRAQLIDEHSSCWANTITYLEYLWKKAYKKMLISWKNYRLKDLNVNKKSRQTETENNNQTTIELQRKPNSTMNLTSFRNFDIIHRPYCRYHQLTHCSSIQTPPYLCSSSTIGLAGNSHQLDVVNLPQAGNTSSLELQMVPDSSSFFYEPDNNSVPSMSIYRKIMKPLHVDLETEDKNQCDCYPENTIPDGLIMQSETEEQDNVEEENSIKPKSKLSKFFNRYIWSCFRNFQQSVAKFVESKYFSHIVLSAILMNTILMSAEYHGQPQALTNALEYSNFAFALVYAAEMMLKIITDGYLKYIKNIYNLLDSGIVIISIIELQGHRNSGLSVLRTFRLLRVLKLVRYMPALRQQLVVMLQTIDNVATFFSLLLLFIFIFSILGMNLFGCKFCKNPENDNNETAESECPRKNFDSLLWATITVFQVLTQEDWHGVLYSGMKNTNAWAALYFIALMTFGNYVLFNLLVAILVEGFSSDKGPANTDAESTPNRLANIDPFTTQALLTGYIEKLSHPHEPSIDQSKRCNQEPKASEIKGIKKNDYLLIQIKLYLSEMKTIRIPRIAISNQHTAGLSIAKNHFKPNANQHSNSSSPYKSITKMHSSEQQSLSSLSFHTCIQSSNVFLSRQHRSSITSMKNRSSTSVNDDYLQIYDNVKSQSLLSPMQRRSSNQESLKNRSFGYKDQYISQEINESNLLCKRRSTIDSSNYSRSQKETSSVYETPKHNHTAPYLTNPYRIDGDKISNVSITTMSNQSDMQNNLRQNQNKQNRGICRTYLTRFCDNRFCKYFDDRENYALYIFSPENRFRQMLKRLVVKKSFDHLTLIFIALNCITVAMESPTIPAASFERLFLNITNVIFTIVFTIEMMAKVIAVGFVFGPDTYLHSGWNAMDGLLVLISIVDLVAMHQAALISSNPKSEGATHIFIINRVRGLKLVLQTLISSLQPIGHIVVICCTFFIIFGILGVQLFKGKFYYCEGPYSRNVTTRQQCEGMPDHRWKNQQYNFDNLGQALLCLFVLSSRDGWVQIMYNGIDAVEVDVQPIRNYNPAKIVYFISFLLLVGFCILNMFVGVVVENFHKCRAEQEREEKEMRLAECARKLEAKRRRMLKIPYYVHFGLWRRRLHRICTSKYFDLIVATIIILNVVTMSLEFYLMPPALNIVLDYCNYTFTVVFIIEAISKTIALGPLRYLKDRWNQIDIAIVILSISGIIVEKMNNGHILPINPTLIRVMRVLRIARVLKLLKMAKGIRALLNTVMEALPQVGNLSLLFLLLFFIFAALGVELFGRLECSDERPCAGLDKHAHFKVFGMSFLTLFRIATGDNWNGIMKDALRADDSIHDGKNGFMSIIAPIYFVAFVLMAQFVLVNVVVAVLMKKLDESNQMMTDDAETDEDTERHLTAIASAQDYSKKSFLNNKYPVFADYNYIPYFPCKRRLSLPTNFTFHSIVSAEERAE